MSERLYDAEFDFADQLPASVSTFNNIHKDAYEDFHRMIQHIQTNFRMEYYDYPVKLFVRTSPRKNSTRSGFMTYKYKRGYYVDVDKNILPPKEEVTQYIEVYITLQAIEFHRIVLIHELAHWLNFCTYKVPEIYRKHKHHNAQFCSIYLWMIKEFLGEEHAKLLWESFRKYKVRTDKNVLKLHGIEYE